MPRKHDAHKDELEGVAQRLRDERPEASPLDLDRIKTTAMSRARAGTGRGRAGARRLAVASLTVGLLAATTGGVLAGGHGHKNSGGSNAANAQYGGECNVNVGNGNVGDNNGSNDEIFNCIENSFNETTVTTNITNYYNGGTVTVVSPPAPTGGVLGASTKKAKTSSKHVKIHINLPSRSKLKKVTLKVNGKIVSVLKGKKASKNITLVSLPCGATVTITAVTASGKTVTQTHTYNLC